MENVTNKFMTLGKAKSVNGSILLPETSGLAFILNIANLAGKTEGGLYPTFDKKWVKVKQEVRGWYATKTGAYKLGAVNTIAVQSNVWVINLLCQNDNLVTDTTSLSKALKEVCKMAIYEHSSVHVSHLLTDSIPELSNLLKTELLDKGVNVYLYNE